MAGAAPLDLSDGQQRSYKRLLAAAEKVFKSTPVEETVHVCYTSDECSDGGSIAFTKVSATKYSAEREGDVDGSEKDLVWDLGDPDLSADNLTLKKALANVGVLLPLISVNREVYIQDHEYDISGLIRGLLICPCKETAKRAKKCFDCGKKICRSCDEELGGLCGECKIHSHIAQAEFYATDDERAP